MKVDIFDLVIRVSEKKSRQVTASIPIFTSNGCPFEIKKLCLDDDVYYYDFGETSKILSIYATFRRFTRGPSLCRKRSGTEPLQHSTLKGRRHKTLKHSDPRTPYKKSFFKDQSQALQSTLSGLLLLPFQVSSSCTVLQVTTVCTTLSTSTSRRWFSSVFFFFFY